MGAPTSVMAVSLSETTDMEGRKRWARSMDDAVSCDRYLVWRRENWEQKVHKRETNQIREREVFDEPKGRKTQPTAKKRGGEERPKKQKSKHNRHKPASDLTRRWKQVEARTKNTLKLKGRKVENVDTVEWSCAWHRRLNPELHAEQLLLAASLARPHFHTTLVAGA